jgi:excisionase family DNA binding protein
MTTSIPRRTYTLPEVAALLGIGRSTAYDLVARGELQATRIGRRWIVSPVVLEKMLGERPPLPRDLGSNTKHPTIPGDPHLNVMQRNQACPTPLDRSEKTP